MIHRKKWHLVAASDVDGTEYVTLLAKARRHGGHLYPTRGFRRSSPAAAAS